MSLPLTDHEFKIGEVCMLRSGSVALTVTYVNNSTGFRTVMYFDNGAIKMDTIPSICLKPYI